MPHVREFAAVLIVLVFLVPAATAADDESPAGGWKAGRASVVITPRQNMWMAGYASRDKPAQGTAQDLFAKALALEDAAGTRLVVVTTDLIGIPRSLRDAVAVAALARYELPGEALLLNASHTHCGPVVRESRSSIYELASEEARRVEEYVAALETRLVDLIGDALADLSPARLGYSHARAGFAMNRRLPTERGFQNSPHPDGPVDHSVPVLRVESAEGELRAILFGYACHNTTLAFFEFCGDYAGFAQQFLEEAHPGVTALFLTGCGGDQNPYPRGTLELARRHGRTLATAVEAALLPAPRPVGGPLRSALEEVELEFAPPPAREELLRDLELPNRFARRRARLLLDELDEKGAIRATYPYPVQVVRFGNDLTLVALAGEVVVDYSLRLKQDLDGPPVWVAGYSNDVFGYLPSVRVLKEGGYEGGGAMLYTALAGPFAPSVEERVVAKVHELVKRLE